MNVALPSAQRRNLLHGHGKAKLRGLLTHSVGRDLARFHQGSVLRKHAEREVGVQGQHPIHPILFPAYSRKRISCQRKGLFRRNLCGVGLQIGRQQDGILHMDYLGGIDRVGVFLEKLVGRLDREIPDGLAIEFFLGPGLGVGTKRQQQEKACCQDDTACFH